MHGSGIPIWFFIGVLMFVYGLIVFGYGLYELATGIYPPVQLAELHAPVWWGAILLAIGIVYILKFRPVKAGK